MSVMLTFTDLEAAASGVKPAGGADISLGLAGAASADPSTLDSVGTPAASLPVAGREPNYYYLHHRNDLSVHFESGDHFQLVIMEYKPCGTSELDRNKDRSRWADSFGIVS